MRIDIPRKDHPPRVEFHIVMADFGNFRYNVKEGGLGFPSHLNHVERSIRPILLVCSQDAGQYKLKRVTVHRDQHNEAIQSRMEWSSQNERTG